MFDGEGKCVLPKKEEIENLYDAFQKHKHF
jgi:hypothetical protein